MKETGLEIIKDEIYPYWDEFNEARFKQFGTRVSKMSFIRSVILWPEFKKLWLLDFDLLK